MPDYNMKTFQYDSRGYGVDLNNWIDSDIASFVADTDVRVLGAVRVTASNEYTVVTLLWNRDGASASASPSGSPSGSPSATPSSSPSSSPSASPSEGTPSASPSGV